MSDKKKKIRDDIEEYTIGKKGVYYYQMED